MKNKNKFFISLQIGFTLLELLMTVSIVAVLATIAIPSFITTIKNNKLTTVVNEFVVSLNSARSEAIKRGHRVSLCTSSDGLVCALTGSWDQGWLIFADINNNNIFDPAEAPALKIYNGVVSSQITIIGSAAVQNRVTYSQTGQGVIPIGAKTITFCDDRIGNFGKRITFSNLGRASTSSGIIC